MSKISEMQKNGISVFPPETGNTERDDKPGHVMAACIRYGEEIMDMDKAGFFAERDMIAEKMMESDLPEELCDVRFELTRQSFDAMKLYYSSTDDTDQAPPESPVYFGEKNGIRYFYCMQILHETGNVKAGIVRIKENGKADQWTGREWQPCAELSDLLKAITDDPAAREYVLKARMRMCLSVLTTDPVATLNEIKNLEPLFRLERELGECAGTKTVFPEYGMESGQLFSTFLAASDPFVSGTAVRYENGEYVLMQFYVFYEEQEGLVFIDDEKTESARHLIRDIYRTKNYEELVPLLKTLWNRLNGGKRRKCLPLSENAAFVSESTDFGEKIVFAEGTSERELNEKEKYEFKRIKDLPPWSDVPED